MWKVQIFLLLRCWNPPVNRNLYYYFSFFYGMFLSFQTIQSAYIPIKINIDSTVQPRKINVWAIGNIIPFFEKTRKWRKIAVLPKKPTHKILLSCSRKFRTSCLFTTMYNWALQANDIEIAKSHFRELCESRFILWWFCWNYRVLNILMR